MQSFTLRGVFLLIGRLLRHHIWLIAGVVLYSITAYAVLYFYVGKEYELWTGYSDVMARYTFVSTLILWSFHALYVLVFVRPARPAGYLWQFYRTNIFRPFPFLSFIAVFSCISLFTMAFSTFKSMIPFVHPYSMDVAFFRLDRAVHLGADPWRILQPVLGSPVVTFIVNLLYNLWFTVLYLMWLFFAFDMRRPFHRMRFFVCCFLVWAVLGNGAAVLLSSAGPCYFSRIVTDMADPYAELMEYLHYADGITSVWALGVQDMLWERYQEFSTAVGSGISAMPSMHVGMVFLFWLALRDYFPRMARVMLVYVIAIFIGSIHLGWHYAVDGYASAIGVWLLWQLCGWMLKKDPLYKEAEV